MIGTIKYIADMPEDGSLIRGTFSEFISWLWEQKIVEFDIETDITEWWNTRKLISMQFGSCTEERVQWFLQWSELSFEQREEIRKYLENQYRIKVIHNAAYEYIVCKFHGIIIENVYDTMLAEKVLRGGLENENYALADITWKYVRIMMDKTEQKNFGDNIMTPSKIVYGITDVAYLTPIRRQQMLTAGEENLLNVIGLENEAVLAFSDITHEGMILDKEKWRENIELAKPLVIETEKQINSWLLKEPMHSYAVHKGYISSKDRVEINFNSHQQKLELLQLIFPDLTGSSEKTIQTYIDRYHHVLGPERLDLIGDVLVKDYNKFQDYLVQFHRDYLVECQYLIPAGVVTINWNSGPQVLPLMQLLVPKLKGIGEDERNKNLHPVLKDYENYKDALGLVTRYGEDFITDYVGPDGKVRTNFNQVVSTGRVSSKNPNMQNIIVTEEVGTRYRNAFTCEPGWEFVDSDFTGQELALIAWVSKDPIWLGAIARGEDIHSIVAELMFAEKWKAGRQEDCAYHAMIVSTDGKMVQAKQKCSCKVHKKLRYDSKAIDFGLAYGMSEIKLAADLKISRSEALALLNKFFQMFPGIKATLDYLGQFGVQNGYIMTIFPFNRKRWFPYWKEYLMYRDVHIQGIKYIPTLGEIERASKNHPFQGSGADMMKVAMVVTRNYIRDNGLRDRVKLVMQVHDQLTTIARSDYAEQWIPILDSLMNESAKLFIPTGILKAETLKNPTWTK